MFNKTRRSAWLGGVLIILLTVLAYSPALRNGFIWDDDDYVTENSTLRDLNGLKRIWLEVGAVPQYYPLVHTGFWFEYQLWGLRPFGYHLNNVLLHALAAVFFWRVLARLQSPGAWLAAAVFALHPVGVESVAWVTERKNVLSGAFYFAAVLAYLRFDHFENAPLAEKKKSGVRTPSRRWRWYVMALGLFVCAMFSKTVACSLPAALLLVCWWKKGRLRGGDILPTLPFFGIGIGLGLLTVWIEKHSVGAQGADWALTFWQRCLIAGRALWFYAGKLVWPVDLTFIYPRWEISTAVWWQWLFPVAALAVVAALWFWRNRIGRGPLVAVLFFAGTLFPALGFFNVYPMRFSFVADHFQYLASVGLIAMAAAGLTRISGRVFVVLPLALGVLAWQQVQIYRNAATVWEDTLAKNPACWLAHNNLGLIVKGQGRIKDAEAHYRAALRAKPDYADALNNLGQLAFEAGRVEDALRLYERAVKSDPGYVPALVNLATVRVTQSRYDEAITQLKIIVGSHPGNVDAWNNLGVALAGKKDYDQAIKCYETVLKIKPDAISSLVNMGKIYADTGRTGEAVAQFEQALRFAPDSIDAKSELARTLGASGRTVEAIFYYRQMLKLAPKDSASHYNLATLLSRSGQVDEAITEYLLALKFNPGNAEAHNNLGITLTLKQQLGEAVRHFQEALRLRPDNAEAHNNMAYVLVRMGRRNEAVTHLREALRLQPDYAQARQQLRDLGVEPPPAPNKSQAP